MLNTETMETVCRAFAAVLKEKRYMMTQHGANELSQDLRPALGDVRIEYVDSAQDRQGHITNLVCILPSGATLRVCIKPSYLVEGQTTVAVTEER